MGEWIPISEQKPEPYGTVLGYFYGRVEEVTAAWVAGPYNKASHWMPLPAPPAGTEGGE